MISSNVVCKLVLRFDRFQSPDVHLSRLGWKTDFNTIYRILCFFGLYAVVQCSTCYLQYLIKYRTSFRVVLN